MAIHVQLILSTILYLFVLTTGLTITISLAVVKGLAGKCILFVTVSDTSKNGTTTGNPTVCDFVMYLPAFTSLYSLLMLIYHGYASLVAFREQHIGRTMWIMPWLLLNSLVVIVTFIAACIFNIGLHQTCSNLKQISTQEDPNCGVLMTKFYMASESKVYNIMLIVQWAYWISVVLWIGIFIVSVIRLLRNLRARSAATYDDPTVSDTKPITELPPTA